MTEVFSYLIENAESLLSTLVTIIAAASAVAALTPTPKDDTWLSTAYKLVDWLALNVGKAKQK